LLALATVLDEAGKGKNEEAEDPPAAILMARVLLIVGVSERLEVQLTRALREKHAKTAKTVFLIIEDGEL